MPLIQDIESKGDLDALLKAFKEGTVRVPTGEFDSFNPNLLLGFEQLATKP
jgi:hypothetical protein